MIGVYSILFTINLWKIIFMRDIPEKFVLDEFSDNKKLVKNKKTSY